MNSGASKVDIVLVRTAFCLLLSLAAATLNPLGLPRTWAAGLGLLLGLLTILLEFRLRSLSLKSLVGSCAGILLGGCIGLIFAAILGQSSLTTRASTPFVQIAILGGFTYLGMSLGLAKSDQLNLSALGMLSSSDGGQFQSWKILDTSVLIDGRIADIVDAGFVDGVLAVPEFVLHELQGIADSSDSGKRNRGRRGLDVLQRLQKSAQIRIQLPANDFTNVREVDLKLIELAKVFRCKIMTNDFNLNKVAQVHGVGVLNINELANAIRPVVLPGETMRVFILKEGKEYNQGVAYLDDGTMVVVDNARRHLSKNVDVIVTSVLQTTAGKMIFGRFDDRQTSNTVHHANAPAGTVAPTGTAASTAGTMA